MLLGPSQIKFWQFRISEFLNVKRKSNPSYLRQFTQELAKITKFLTSCLNIAKIVHYSKLVKYFDKYKIVVCNHSILKYTDFSNEFISSTHVSDVALGDILSHDTSKINKPIAHAS